MICRDQVDPVAARVDHARVNAQVASRVQVVRTRSQVLPHGVAPVPVLSAKAADVVHRQP